MFLCLLPADAFTFRRHVILQVLKQFSIREQNTKAQVVWPMMIATATNSEGFTRQQF